jgi:hypothetical protein
MVSDNENRLDLVGESIQDKAIYIAFEKTLAHVVLRKRFDDRAPENQLRVVLMPESESTSKKGELAINHCGFPAHVVSKLDLTIECLYGKCGSTR